jgi:inward rectifier potassium channel
VYFCSWFFFGLLYHICAADGCLAGDGVQEKATGFGGHSVWTSFFFSVEVMTTIGFGDMYPRTPYANVVFAIQSLFGVFVEASTIGIIFAKFSRATSRATSLVFSSSCIIGPRNGVESLSFRVANTRKHQLLESHISLYLSYPERTTEGELCFRFDRLEVEDIGPFLSAVPTTVVHVIDEHSPFLENPRLLDRAELVVLLEGIDSTTSCTTQARHSYVQSDVIYQARFSDMLSFENGVVTVDMHEFNRTLPIAPGRFSAFTSRGKVNDYDSESASD